MRKVEAPLSMTMGVDDGKRAKSASLRGRVTGDISPAAAAGLAGGGGGERFGAFGSLVLLLRRPLRLLASSKSTRRLTVVEIFISVKDPVLSHNLYTPCPFT